MAILSQENRIQNREDRKQKNKRKEKRAKSKDLWVGVIGDLGLRTPDLGLRTPDHGLRTRDYGLTPTTCLPDPASEIRSNE